MAARHRASRFGLFLANFVVRNRQTDRQTPVITLHASDLSLDKHDSSASAACFYWLRQPGRVRRSLHDESAKTLLLTYLLTYLYHRTTNAKVN